MVEMCRSCFHHSTLYLGNIFERHRTKINIQKIATCAALVHWVKEEVHHGKISQKLFRLFRAVNKWKVACMGETQETSTQCDLRDALVVRVAQFPAAHPGCKSYSSSDMSENISLSAVSSNLRIADCWWYYRVISTREFIFHSIGGVFAIFIQLKSDYTKRIKVFIMRNDCCFY